jgi:divalent metal cation (Fe/Co/Zn/Cd) transporter
VQSISDLRLRWSGHRLNLQAAVHMAGDATIADFHQLEHRIERANPREPPQRRHDHCRSDTQGSPALASGLHE